MCKLYIVTGSLTAKQLKHALTAANKAFRGERDGYGFLAAQGIRIARGRYLNPEGFAGYMQNLPPWLCGPSIEENHLPAKTDVLICHGRTSTNVKHMDNVHPFHYRSNYLAHNGMVTWQGPSDERPKQSCDSEQLLHWLVNTGFDWPKAFHVWGGWGAIAVYNRKTSVLTIARDGASLHIARRVNGKGWVLATDAKHLVGISKVAGISIDTPPLNFPRHIVEFRHGEIIGEKDWLGFGARQWNSLDATAFGSTNKVQWKQTEREFFPDYNGKAK